MFTLVVLYNYTLALSQMPIFSSNNDVQFAVCKIEAGKAILLSEDNFELLEVPAMLIPSQHVGSNVRVRVEPVGSKVDLAGALSAIKSEYGVAAEDVARLKETIGADGFFKVDAVGCNCASLSWKSSLHALLQGIRGGSSVLCYAVDLVRLTTRESLPIEDGNRVASLRLDLSWTEQVEVALLFRTSIGSFWTQSLSISRADLSEQNFSHVWLVTDLPAADERIQKVLQRGGRVGHCASLCNNVDCITAAVTNSPTSELFAVATKTSVPVVNCEWLELLVTLNRLPTNYSEFLPQSK